MKKVILLALMLLFVPLVVYAEEEPITRLFTDDGFRDAILEHINYGIVDPDEFYEEIFSFHMEEITFLDASGRGIESLEGIENLVRLVTLDVSDNEITEIYFAIALGESRLEALYARNNQLTNVAIANHVELKHIDLRGNAYLDVQNLYLPFTFEHIELDEFEPGELLLELDDDAVYDGEDGRDDYDPAGQDNDGEQNDIPTILVEEAQIKQAMFEALMVAALLQDSDDDEAIVYLRVDLSLYDDGWRARAREVRAPADAHLQQFPAATQVPAAPDLSVTVFAWILALSAIIGLVLSGILYALRKE